tara:strand:+ start:13892 stop:14518 length:627 start_codon:yes stop_codon:yes gene_type:complete
MSIKNRAIERFGNKAFSMRPTFYNNKEALRFELGVGNDSLTYKSTALHRLNTILDDLGFKHHPIGIAAYCYLHDPSDDEGTPPLNQQLLPFAKDLRDWGNIQFRQSEYMQIRIDEDSSLAYHFGETTIDHGLLSRWLKNHLFRDFGDSSSPLLMLFNVDLGIMINPYDDRGLDVFGSNHDLLNMLYRQRNDWLLDHDREQMNAVYKDC